ncbi:unnamed protein product [Orchesella dallaii]|uniref:Laminin G domain-containing protein n=1 Tax=Orchesella dallaii TaxID=48710 RepID=A0ABP1RK10_9HEXA
MLEVQLDFRSDSRNGMLLSLVPNKGSRYPKFTIFLRDGNVVARETISLDEYDEAVTNFEVDKGLVWDGHWHNVRANYEKGSITLREDARDPIYSLEEPGAGRVGQFSSSSYVGTIYIGGMDDGASRSNSKVKFHGCIRNIVLNRRIRDSPSTRWKTFVANRVVAIQDAMASDVGIMSLVLIIQLILPSEVFQSKSCSSLDMGKVIEEKPKKILVGTLDYGVMSSVLMKISSLQKVVSTAGWLIRFISFIKDRQR